METVSGLDYATNPAELYAVGSTVCPISMAVGYGVADLVYLTYHCYRIEAGGLSPGYNQGWGFPLELTTHTFCGVSDDGKPEPDTSQFFTIPEDGSGCYTFTYAPSPVMQAGQLISAAPKQRNIAISFKSTEQIANKFAAFHLSCTIFVKISALQPVVP
jgi:hypothetical protein